MFISWFLIDFGGKITVINPLGHAPATYQVLTKNLFSLNALPKILWFLYQYINFFG